MGLFNLKAFIYNNLKYVGCITNDIRTFFYKSNRYISLYLFNFQLKLNIFKFKLFIFMLIKTLFPFIKLY